MLRLVVRGSKPSKVYLTPNVRKKMKYEKKITAK